MPKMKNPLVRLEDAGFMRGGRWLVRGVDLSINSGEIVTLIGPNGSGKSTTAKLALGVEQPSEGKVSRRDGLKVSYVPQRVSIDWTMPLRVRGLMTLTGEASEEDMDLALHDTGADLLRDREVRHLSGGEFQRVMLARAIARKPELLVLDEPVQGVDTAGEASLYRLIAGVRDRLSCGILLISHDLHMVMSATDRVVCLNGHVCCQGTPESVTTSVEYQSLFGAGNAGMLALYQHHHDHTHLADGRVLHADGSVSDHCHPLDGHHHQGHGNADKTDKNSTYSGFVPARQTKARLQETTTPKGQMNKKGARGNA